MIINKEQEYQEILDKREQEAIQNSEEEKYEERKFVRLNEVKTTELIPLFNQYSRKFDSKQLVCAYRTTGGYESNDDLSKIFTHDRIVY
jgi:hypothetical protein